MTYRVISDALRAFAFCLKYISITRTKQQKGICLMKGDEVIAAAVYDEYNGQNIFVHLAGKPGRKWLNREFLKWGFDYPFNQLGVKRLTAWVHADNLESVRFVEHIGFRREATLEKAGPGGVDVYIFVMFREECRYV